MKKSFQPVLRLSRLSVQDKVTKAKFVVASMTGNAYFPTPNPELSVITTDADNLETAAAVAEGGGIKLTADMHAKEDVLVRDLKVLMAYVEEIANSAVNLPNAVAIITSAGMEVKISHPHGPTDFQVNTTGVMGEIKCRTAYVNGVIYHWQQSSDGITWVDIGVSRKSAFTQGELTLGARYHFRFAIEEDNGIGPWSDSVSIVVE
jgi:hypothetical protein